ncbi:MAG: hypothetical protein ACI9EZ_000386 [Halobacteriales archaeon]|jgi:hypothetical protein
MSAAYFAQTGAEAETAIAIGRTLAFAAITVAASVLVYYLTVSVRAILVSTYEDRWWYFAVGVAAAIVYGVSGLAELATAYGETAAAFRFGATLFFFLFSAVGMRALYATVHLDRGDFRTLSIPGWAWYVVIGAFIVAWWGAYLSDTGGAVALVEAVGLAGAVTYSLVFAVLTVRDAEGTAIAAILRQFVPAMIGFTGIVVAEQAGRYTGIDQGIVVGVELVGTVLVGAFLFTTAVAIRQQGEEVGRMYDRTTWREQKLE